MTAEAPVASFDPEDWHRLPILYVALRRLWWASGSTVAMQIAGTQQIVKPIQNCFQEGLILVKKGSSSELLTFTLPPSILLSLTGASGTLVGAPFGRACKDFTAVP